MTFKIIKKNSRKKYFFSEAIIRLLACFMGILIFYSTAQIIVERILIKKIRYQNAIVANQRAKRELGSIIKEKILLLEIHLQKNIFSDNKYARDHMFRHANQVMDSLESLLPVLQHGGTFSHSIAVNLNTLDEVVENISYDKFASGAIKQNNIKNSIFIHQNNIDSRQNKNVGTDNFHFSPPDKDIIVEVIAILPKINELRDLLSKLRNIRVSMETTTGPEAEDKTKLSNQLLQQYILEANALLLRCRENSNKIFFDTNMELKKLLNERERFLNRFDSIRKYFYFIFQIIITIMFLCIFMRIISILKAGMSAENENRKLLSAIKLSPLSVIISDKESRIEYVNPAFETITGYTAHEVIRKKTSILNSGYHDSAFYKDMWKTLLSGRIWHNEIQNKKKDGELFWESTTIIPVTDSDREISHYVAIKEDMTEKINLLKSYEESNAIFEEIFTNMPVGIVLISSDKHILQLNKEAERILGYKPGEGEKFLQGRICHNNYCTINEKDCPIYDLKHKKVVLQERNALKKDGSIVNILKSVIPIKLNGEEVLLEAFMDITAVKEAEKAILEAKNAAESANRAKSEFLANMSHEIRTPMNAIIGFSDILLAAETRPDTREHLAMISQSAYALLDLINEILDFSKIEAGKIEIQSAPFSFRNLLYQLSSMFFIKTQEKNLVIEVIIEDETPEYAVGDELRLRQVLVNLIGNAIKFTTEGTITIKAGYKMPYFVIEIQDTGIGIPKDRIQSIFNAFEQADNSTEREYGGTGLGLSISLSLIRLMGGNISVQSNEGQGALFMLKIPMKIPETEIIQKYLMEEDTLEKQDFFQNISIINSHDLNQIPAHQINSMPSNYPGLKALPPLKCLVVEDNPANIALVQVNLKRMNIESDAAENGKIALDMMSRVHYDFVILDMHMPVMNGLETIEAMRSTGTLFKIPVIALTADAIKGHGKKYLKAGCDAYIAKPFKRDALESKIKHLIPHAFAPKDKPQLSLEFNEVSQRNKSQKAVFSSLDIDSEIQLIEKTMELLQANCEIFDQDELTSLSTDLKKKTASKRILDIALQIESAALSFDDEALTDLLESSTKIHEDLKSTDGQRESIK